MVLAQLENLFLSNEYMKVPSNLPEFTFFFRRENHGINVIYVIDYKQGLYITKDQYTHIREKIITFFREKGNMEVHILSLILSNDLEKAKQISVEDPFCWIVDTQLNRLVIYENQVPDFYGVRALLEDFLKQPKSQDNFLKQSEDQDKEKKRQLPWVNITIVAINVIVFLICTFTGELLYNIGAFGVRDIIEDGAYYRIFTSMFLHADVEHLFSNMIVLYYVGEIVERKIGHLPYAAVYVLSGIAGDVMSMAYELLSGDYISSVGASGAVFGIEGALLLLLVLHRGKLEYMTAGRVAFAIAFSLYCGFTSTNVNNAAHVGGVLMGFALTGILWMLLPRIRKKG